MYLGSQRYEKTGGLGFITDYNNYYHLHLCVMYNRNCSQLQGVFCVLIIAEPDALLDARILQFLLQ